MKSRIRFLAAMVLMTPAAPSPAGGAQFQIAADGRSACSIVTPKHPSRAEAFAAEELGRYLERMSGARLRQRQGGRLPAKALVVAEQANLGAWNNSFGLADVTGEAYAIAVKDSRIFLVGGRGRSTLYAVYDFLGRLGCRWLAPNYDYYQGSAEVVPKLNRLSFSLPQPVVERPAFGLRGLMTEVGMTETAETLKQTADWLIKTRQNVLVITKNIGLCRYEDYRDRILPDLLKRDMVIEVGGHGWGHYLNPGMENGRLWQQHPEWFGMDAQGVRQKEWEAGGKAYIFCTSNPDAVRHLTANVLTYLKSRPEINVFDLWPPDFANWCQCDKCKALGNPADRQGLVLNHVAAELRELRPNLTLGAAIYSNYEEPPTHVKYDPSIRLDFAFYEQNFQYQINDPQCAENAHCAKVVDGWLKAFDGRLGMQPFYWRYAFRSLPMLVPHYFQKEVQYFVSKRANASYESMFEPLDWFPYELNYYTMAELIWNPSADVDGLITRFAAARYGSAAKAAIAAYSALEDVERRCSSVPGISLKSVPEITEAQQKLALAVAALQSARASLSEPAPRRHIETLLLVLEYDRRDLDIQKLRTARAAPQEIQKQVQALADWINEHALIHDALLVHPRERRLSAKDFSRDYSP